MKLLMPVLSYVGIAVKYKYFFQNETEETYKKVASDIRLQCPESTAGIYVDHIYLQVYAESVKEVLGGGSLAIPYNKQQEAIEKSDKVMKWFNDNSVSKTLTTVVNHLLN